MEFYNTLSSYYDIIFPVGEAQLKFIKKRAKNKKKVLDLAAGHLTSYAPSFSTMFLSIQKEGFCEGMMYLRLADQLKPMLVIGKTLPEPRVC